MSHKIIKPEGIELIEYLNNGYAICNRCGAVMEPLWSKQKIRRLDAKFISVHRVD